ncbi:Arm DNA-binding domain-containing protein [Flavobacteriaceae bacterium]|nr:Arm DNA-binding domain-containing protein [Flavobacteriaceae bacterium]
MMLRFVFKSVRKTDGKAQLYIRIKDSSLNRKDNDRRVKVDGVFIDPKLWNKSLSRVEVNHENCESINDILLSYSEKMLDVRNKYNLKQIDFDTAVKMLSSAESAISIKEYIRTIFSQFKEAKHAKNCLDSVITVGNHLGISELLFSDITELNLIRLRNKLLGEGKSPNTYNTYVRNILVVCKHARKRKFIYQDFNFGSEIKAKTPPMPIIKTASPDDIYRAIDNIEITFKSQRSYTKVLREFEAVGFWLLMFCMRGFYPEDIHDLTSHDLDYDFDREIDSIKKGYHDEKIIGRKLVYMHRRHKGQYPMNMLLIPPIMQLINVLRKLVAITHPHISFSEVPDFFNTRIDLIKLKPKEEIDFLKIFSITNEKSPKLFSNTWRLYRKKAKDIGLPEFKIARKTFMSIALEMGVPDNYGRALLGQVDQTISKHYKDLSRPRIVGKLAFYHLSIIREFDVINLTNYMIDKLSGLFAKKHKDFILMHRIDYPQEELFSVFEQNIMKMLDKSDVRILSIGG